MVHPSFPQLASLLLTTFICLFSSSSSRLPYESRLELAMKHLHSMEQRTQCYFPQPRVVLVETKELRDQWLRVKPSATVLHRCGASSGCCASVGGRCVAKRTEKVPLFFVVTRQGPGRVARGHMKVKRWVFTNHTECHCRVRDEVDMVY